MKNNQKIPEGWSVKKLRECLEIKHGKPQHDIEDPRGMYPILASGGQIGKTNSFLCSEPSVLIGRKGTIDKPQYMETPFWTVDTLFYSHIKSGYIAKYLFYKFETINWNKYNEGSTIPSLSSSTIHSIKVLLPPLAEQEKIAGILGTWDEAIEKLSRLIEQKKLLKKGLMQKLLTGKIRLNGFTQPWKEVKLGDFLKEHTEKTTENDQYQVLSVTKNGICSQEEYFEKQIASENNIGYKILRKHDIVFSPMNLWMGSIGFSEYDIGIVSPAYKIFSVNENVALFSFLKHFMIINRMIYLYLINSEQGASIVRRNLDLDGLLSSKVSIPDITEQQAIADVLSAADDEIDLLNKKLILFKEQKKGLMQQLLTGQTRVKVN